MRTVNEEKPSTTKLCCVIYNRENWLISLLRKAVKMIKNNWRKHRLFSEIKLTSTETQGLLRRGSSLRSDPSPFYKPLLTDMTRAEGPLYIQHKVSIGIGHTRELVRVLQCLLCVPFAYVLTKRSCQIFLIKIQQ